MIKLHIFGDFGRLPDPSPFCVKVDCYLRMAGLPFETVAGMDNLQKAPKGKLPFIEDQGKYVADSQFIISYLKQTYGDKLDHTLTPRDKAISHSMIKMLDENFYWGIVHSRWQQESGWRTVKAHFFEDLPFYLKPWLPGKVRKGLLGDLKSHGMGLHEDSEIMQVCEADLMALSKLLGQQPYFFGEAPTTLDAVVYAFVAELVFQPFETPLSEKAKTFPELVAFCERVAERFYPERS